MNRYGFKGWVQNSTAGVTIDIEGEENDILKFIDDIPRKAPELAVVESVKHEFMEKKDYHDFKIINSDCNDPGFVLVSPDVSTCGDCYREMMDPHNKRYGYPFINCTNCGPRFTIIKDLPYDRDRTTMAKFPMCSDCSREYHDIENRRYHAEPTCCPDCGPSIWLCGADGRRLDGDGIRLAVQKMAAGSIVAIKGLGGFHLACNAFDTNAVNNLRQRKRRERKPFALMCRDVETIRKYAYVSADEKRILESIRKPIVLLKKIKGCAMPDEVAPDNDSLGFMLPYTPIHYLLFREQHIDTLIMTSANISDNPVIYKNEDALSELKGIADYFLIHNRDINTRCDDSVVKVYHGREYFIRRSRGYAPFPIKFMTDLKPILGCGAEQKASFSLSRGRYIFLSQHIGDLKNYETLKHYEEQIENFKRLFKIEPEIVACDLHPDYMSTDYANRLKGVDRVYVQHHFAHMASCMADNSLDQDVIGLIWDGTGYGTDGTIWGGEIMTGNYAGFQRRGTFLKTRLPGGDRAVKDLCSMAVSYLKTTYGSGYPDYIDKLVSLKGKVRNLRILDRMIDRGINSPYTSSCGRLFDGVSAMLGICAEADYEGQGAVRLETAAARNIGCALEFDIVKDGGLYIYDWRSTVEDIVNLCLKGEDISFIASAFHNTVAAAGVRLSELVREDTGINKIVLSGGVFQNGIILDRVVKSLTDRGFEVYTHGRVSTNDEGISVGQLVIAQNGGGLYVPCGTVTDNIDR